MFLFNFHHHNPQINYGIYNIPLNEVVAEIPFSVGLHPKDISENWSSDLDFVRVQSLRENCVAIGECGLDKLVKIDFELQKTILKEQILWANEINKPVIIHCVRSFSEVVEFKKIAKTALVIHGFNKNERVAEELISKGFYLSFGKALLHSVSLQEIVKKTPLDKLFLETDDADYEVALLYNKVAIIKEIDLEILNAQILENLITIQKK